MPSYSSIVQGARARKRVILPRPGAVLNMDTGEWQGPTLPLDVRALRGDEYDRVIADAKAYAKSLGSSDVGDGEELFERGKMLHTLALACIDSDSPKEDAKPFFDGGVKQIASSEELTPEILEYLYEQQRIWQDESNPLALKMTPAEFANAVLRTAQGENGDMSFFVSARPGMRWSFTLSMARLLAASLTLKSLSGSQPTESPESEKVSQDSGA